MRTDLQAAGVQHAGVFGSVARGDDGPESDIDILIHIDHERVKGLLQYIGICADIQASFKEIFPGVDVDVANQETLKPGIRDATERDSIYAF
ncbi:MAG: nucleotidyltransferase [Rhodospirillaceae bacterium]|nr:nucleotidyltransferase [Rhodospirillaceae bacterium]MBT8004530.1 nucleotidyltransferase [Rhodospirillales bacterium]MBT5191612.1 nucleotidyltransferase [Rhodospirillaceae bacterium]MBT5897181.1 nucleotidyltransferase [Rhodospirillaceae bacterium]MBT6426575.1 nucleotidyltransferase [Rhodospirillaceae bacterium]